MSMAFGGAHLGRNALYQSHGNLLKGLRRLVYEDRSTWSKAAGGDKVWLNANNQSLHHMPISARFNRWMNGAGISRYVEWGFRGTVSGIYGAPILVYDDHPGVKPDGFSRSAAPASVMVIMNAGTVDRD
ncbi:MAG: hypothetical protein LBP52_03010 [Burkholderiaceae bacterium]|nr:hypothetical protein [Burkholderiaceae bacterium]